MKLRQFICLVIAMCLGGLVQAQTVVTNTTYASGTTTTVTGPATITTSGNVIVSSGADAAFSATQGISLEPGFHAVSGSNFTASILKSAQNVSSANAVITIGLPFTPAFNGGLGTGPWQFVVSNYTNWPGVGQAGTLLGGSNALSPSWRNTATGTYTFYIRKLGDIGTFDSPAAGPYTLTVTINPTLDSNGDGVPDWVAVFTGHDPSDPNDKLTPGQMQSYQYDAIKRLNSGPGGSYNLDAEGNIKGHAN
jgi:hypothetical protein